MDGNKPQGEQEWMGGVVDRNIRAVFERQRAERADVPLQIRIASTISRFVGSMTFVYVHLVLVAGWIICNLPGTPLPKFDPEFVLLATSASVEAIFISTFVLITQNRMSAEAAKRADLDLQVSLLAEHEVTQLITLVKAIAEKTGAGLQRSGELAELEKDVAPEQVLDLLEKHGNNEAEM